MSLYIYIFQNNIYHQEWIPFYFKHRIYNFTSVPNTVLNPEPSKECAFRSSSDNFSLGEHFKGFQVKKANQISTKTKNVLNAMNILQVLQQNPQILPLF